jgi:hypothetical protein
VASKRCNGTLSRRPRRSVGLTADLIQRKLGAAAPRFATQDLTRGRLRSALAGVTRRRAAVWAAETQTTHRKDVAFTTPDSDCSGAPVTLSGFSSGVEHITFLDSGGIHATFTEVVTLRVVSGLALAYSSLTHRFAGVAGLQLGIVRLSRSRG